MSRVRGKWYERQLLNWRWWLVFPLVTLIAIPLAALIVALRLIGRWLDEGLESYVEPPLLAVSKAGKRWVFSAVDARIRARHAPTPTQEPTDHE